MSGYNIGIGVGLRYIQRGVVDLMAQAIRSSMVVWYDIKRQGATNESMSQNPILKDLSGHGHDATCYNFAWSGQSGIGSYATNFDANKNRANIEILGTQKWLVKNIINIQTPEPILKNYATFSGFNKTVTVVVDGIPDTAPINAITIRFGVTSINLHNGQNTIAFGEPLTTGYILFRFVDTSLTNITIEILPDYPNALVSDGVDDYAYVEGLPLLTDCTAFIMRDLIDIKRDSITVVKGRIGSGVNGYSITVDRIDLEVSMPSYNFLTRSIFGNSWLKDKLIIGSPTFINGWENNLDRINDEFDLLHLLGEPYSQHYAKAALYSFILFDRTLTDEEIEWVKKNLLGVETPEQKYSCFGTGQWVMKYPWINDDLWKMKK